MATRLPPHCAERYRLGDPIAQGGCGSVYHATQIQLNRPVAIKLLHPDVVLDPGAVERFRSEARVTAALSHPNIVKVLDFDFEDGIPWIAYEYVPGTSLRKRVRDGLTKWPMAVRLMAQVASGLSAAHEAGVLHRDVKPENILEGRPGHAKVTDFGVARWAENGVQTQAGMLMGTPAYVSPEMARGMPASPASDLYALGISLYELLTTRRPFVSSTVMGLLDAHLRDNIPRLDEHRGDLPAGLVELGRRLLAKDPKERPESAAALAEELESLLGSIGDTSSEELMPMPIDLLLPGAANRPGVPTPQTVAVAADGAPATPPGAAGTLGTPQTPGSRPSRRRVPAASGERFRSRDTSPNVHRPAGARRRIAFVAGLSVGLGVVLALVALREVAPVAPPSPSASAVDATVATGNGVLERQQLQRDAADPEHDSIKPLLMLGSRDGQEKAARLARQHAAMSQEHLAELEEVLTRLGVTGTDPAELPLPRAILVARTHAAQLFLRMRIDRLQQRIRMADKAMAEQLDSALGLGRLIQLDHDIQYDTLLLEPLRRWLAELTTVAARVARDPAAAPPETGLFLYDAIRVSDQFNVYRFRGTSGQASFRGITTAWDPMQADTTDGLKPGLMMRDLFDIGTTGEASRDPARLARVLATLDRTRALLPQCAQSLGLIQTSLKLRTAKPSPGR